MPAEPVTAVAPERGRGGRWRLLVPAVALVAGLLFATSASTAEGTDLRAGRRVQLTELISAQQQQVAGYGVQVKTLRADIEKARTARAGGDGGVSLLDARATALAPAAGLTPVQGPSLSVSLDDAPRLADGSRPAGATPNDLVVHQQDVQSVINALWMGGAEAMTVQGVRVISTSAVRCVGNVLLLHDAVYPPPYVITAVGDVDRMRVSLEADIQVDLFRQASAAWGLGYLVDAQDSTRLPAYDGPLALQHASVGP